MGRREGQGVSRRRFRDQPHEPRPGQHGPGEDNVDNKATPVDAEADKIEQWLGIPDDAREKYADAAMITPTGDLLDENGQEVIR